MSNQRLHLQSINNSLRGIKSYCVNILKKSNNIYFRLCLLLLTKINIYLGFKSAKLNISRANELKNDISIKNLDTKIEYWIYYDCRVSHCTIEILSYIFRFLMEYQLETKDKINIVIYNDRNNPCLIDTNINSENVNNYLLNVMLEPIYALNYSFNVSVLNSLELFNKLYNELLLKDHVVVYPKRSSDGTFKGSWENRNIFDYSRFTNMPKFEYNKVYREQVKECLLDNDVSGLLICITLRQKPVSLKRGKIKMPDLPTYYKFIKLLQQHELSKHYKLQFIFVPDYYALSNRNIFSELKSLENVFICYEAASSFRFRLELHRECLINLFTLSGSTHASVLDPDVNYLSLNTVYNMEYFMDKESYDEKDFDIAKGSFDSHSYAQYGEDLLWAHRYQKMSWTDIKNENDLLNEFLLYFNLFIKDGLDLKYKNLS